MIKIILGIIVITLLSASIMILLYKYTDGYTPVSVRVLDKHSGVQPVADTETTLMPIMIGKVASVIPRTRTIGYHKEKYYEAYIRIKYKNGKTKDSTYEVMLESTYNALKFNVDYSPDMFVL